MLHVKCYIEVSSEVLPELRTRPLIGKDYPLSLSISLSGGEETNQDFPSNGERTGKSPAWKSGRPAPRIVVWRRSLCAAPDPSSLERDVVEGESPVESGTRRSTRTCLRVGLFGNAVLSGW